MSMSLEEIDTFIGAMFTNATPHPEYLFVRPSVYRALQMRAQGKRFYLGKPHKRKSPIRQSREVREKRSTVKWSEMACLSYDWIRFNAQGDVQLKQTITQAQYEELSDKARMKFIEWTCSKGNHAVVYRSIGHLIWFLDEHITDEWWQIQRDGGKSEWRIESKYNFYEDLRSYSNEDRVELIDTLWNVVKAILEDEQ
jgi:hypothetical protein